MRDGRSSGNFIFYARHKPCVYSIVARTPSVAYGASSLAEGAFPQNILRFSFVHICLSFNLY